MSFFAIRDDDTSAFTKPEDLENVYAAYWGRVPISLAVVPYSVPTHRGRSISELHVSNQPHPLEENDELVRWLRFRLASNHIEVMLHGYSHEYRQIKDRWIGEYGWKPAAQLMQETRKGKQYLETLLDCKIKVFVPPSNTISAGGICALREAGLKLSGIMGRWGDRSLSLNYFRAWQKRWIYRIYHGVCYPFVLRYDGHAELVAHALTPRVEIRDYLEKVQFAHSHQAPFVLATHYWEIQSHPPLHDMLDSAFEIAMQAGMRPISVSGIFEETLI